MSSETLLNGVILSWSSVLVQIMKRTVCENQSTAFLVLFLITECHYFLLKSSSMHKKIKYCTNSVFICVQVLDFERENEYILVLSAQNPVALVRGRYGPASTATVTIFIDDINEGPVLSQSHYEVTVREGEEPGRVIATIRGYDPDSHPIR